MTLLTMVQDAAVMVGLARPAAVVSSNDPAIRRMLALANVEGSELARRHDWTALVKEATWTTLAAESQGLLTTIATDLDQENGARIIDETLWDRTLNRRMAGPASSQKWQRLKASNITGPYSDYRIRQGTLYLIPAPSAGHTGAFEYVSKNWCQNSGSTGQSAWAADDDTGILSERLMKLGIIWRWKASNEMVFAPDQANYERAVQTAIGRDGTRTTLDLGDRENYAPASGVIVPEGTWDL